MADFGIRADIPLSVVGAKRTPLSETIGTATKAMEFSRLSELYPELIRRSKAEAESAVTGAAKSQIELNVAKANQIASGQISMITNPMIVAAAEGKPVDTKQLVAAVEENAKIQAKNAGIDWETQGKQLAAPYIERALNAPGTLRDFYKERMLIGLDAVSKADYLTPKIVTEGLPRPGLFTRAEGIVRELPTISGDGTPRVGAAAPDSAAGPTSAAGPVSAPAAAAPNQRDVIASQLVAPTAQRQEPGFALNFAPRSPRSMEPITDQEKAAIDQGREYFKGATEFRSRAPATIDRVDRVLQTINQIESSREFKAGKAGELEARLRQAFGEQEYKLLEKELADLVIETNRITGGKTDAATALVAQSTGNVSYPPGVLKNVVTKLRGDAFGARMQAEGAQKFLDNGYGEANLRNYRAAWDENAAEYGPRIFEAMSIFSSDRLTPDQKKKAFDKIKPTTPEALEQFEIKARNLDSLAKTGRLPPPQRPAR